MRRNLVIGNWKMNLDYVEAIHLVQQLGILHRSLGPDHTDVVVAPPFVDLRSVTSVIEADRLAIQVAAQHAHHRESGAYTGEVSVGMLKRLGVKYVIVGHSERRQGFAMTDDVVSATVDSVLASGMTPVVCCGESMEVREEGRAEEFVSAQIVSALGGVKPKHKGSVVIAYEPIWAIGSGQAADPDVVRAMLDVIRGATPGEIRDDTQILYGGSVTSENARELMVASNADGFLVGGASLRADEFVGIIAAVEDCYRK